MDIECTAYFDLSTMVVLNAVDDTIIGISQDQSTKQLGMVYKNFVTWSEIRTPLSIYFNTSFTLFDGAWQIVSSFVRSTGEIDNIIVYTDLSGAKTQYTIGRNGQ